MTNKGNQMPHGVFTVDEAAKAGYSRQQLAQWVSAGILDRVAFGLYARVDEPISPTFEMEVLAKRGTDFVVALDSALRVQDFSTATIERTLKRIEMSAHASKCILKGGALFILCTNGFGYRPITEIVGA